MKKVLSRFVPLALALAGLGTPAMAQWARSGWGGNQNPSAPGSVPSNGFWITPTSFTNFNHSNFAGIGAVKSNVDLLSNPARFMTVAPPVCHPQPWAWRPTVTPVQNFGDAIVHRPW